MKKLSLLQKMFEEYAEKNYMEKLSENEYQVEVYMDYRDYDNYEETVKNILGSQTVKSKDHLINLLYDDYYASNYDIDNSQYYYNEFLNEYCERLEAENIDYDTIYDEISIYSNIDFNEVVNRCGSIETIIFLENEESFNYEMSNNDFGGFSRAYHNFNDEEETEEYKEVLQESSLYNLLEKQGYTIDDYVNYYESLCNGENCNLESDNIFMGIIEEIENATSMCNSLVVLKELTADEYFNLKNSDVIKIDKNDTIGYVDLVQGGGSILAIKLKNDMTYKNNKECKVLLNGEYGYKINDIYGQFL